MDRFAPNVRFSSLFDERGSLSFNLALPKNYEGKANKKNAHEPIFSVFT